MSSAIPSTPAGRRGMTVGNMILGFGIRGGSLALGAGTAVVVAHVLDAQGVAQALISVSVGTMLGIIAQGGVPSAVAHRIARVRVGTSTAEDLAQDLRTSSIFLTSVLGIVLLAALPAWPLDPEKLIPGGGFSLLLAAVTMGAGRAASRIYSETNKGYGHVTIAGIGSDLVGPSVGLAAVGLIAVMDREHLTGLTVAWLLAAGWVVAALFALWRAPVRPSGSRSREGSGERFRDVLGVVAVISMLNVGIQQAHVVIAGGLLTVDAAALFAAVARLAALTGTPLVLISAIASPDVGVALNSGNPARISALELRLQRITGLLLLVGASIGLVFLVLGPRVLAVLFGDQYSAGHVELVVLSLGPLASLSTGVAGMCLMQAGCRGRVLRDTVVGSSLAIAGMVIGGWVAGGPGLAVGYAVGQLAINLMLLLTCRRELGILPVARPLAGLAWAARSLRRRVTPIS